MEKQLAASGHRISSRAEAWAAAEAASVEKAALIFPVRKWLVKWEKTFRGKAKWWLVAIDVRPNCGEVLVEHLATERKEWINILRPYVCKDAIWRSYKISESFPEYRERQLTAARVDDLSWSTISGEREIAPIRIFHTEVTERGIKLLKRGEIKDYYCFSSEKLFAADLDDRRIYALERDEIIKYCSR